MPKKDVLFMIGDPIAIVEQLDTGFKDLKD
jgi:hypothetical protein